MIDIQREKLISMAKAAAVMPKPPSLCTMWRWRTRGVRGRKLECVLIGKTPYTTLEALQRFTIHLGGNDAPTARSPRQRDRAIEQAERELNAAGI